MSDEIKVYLTKPKGRKHWQAFYQDPLTGKRVQRTTKQATRTKAERWAGAWEDDLQNGKWKPASKITWAEFRRRYEDEVLAGKADKTFAVCQTTFGHVESILNPGLLRAVTTEQVSRFHAKLLERKLSAASRRTYLTHLKAGLRWATRAKMLAECPEFMMPAQDKGKVMKGRPITTEEFERMLAKVEAVRGTVAAPSWVYLLNGLFLGGLRLDEALGLSWDDADQIRVSLEGRRPMFDIPGHRHKSGKTQILPIAPEFYELLIQTPVEDRTGPVFNVTSKDGLWVMRHMTGVSGEISAIGEAAGVKVDVKRNGKVKYASAHDLRRSFGTRWATRVMPVVLQKLMRHSDIATTMKYYVNLDADLMADQLFAAVESADPGVGALSSGHSQNQATPATTPGGVNRFPR